MTDYLIIDIDLHDGTANGENVSIRMNHPTLLGVDAHVPKNLPHRLNFISVNRL